MNNSRREIRITADGSATIYLADLDESYHSRHGAIQEAEHVFIQNGLNLQGQSVCILEMGFGTGLNALLTCHHAAKIGKKVDYVGVEAFPILTDEIRLMHYADLIDPALEPVFRQMHECQWGLPCSISHHFTLEKHQTRFESIDFESRFDLVYFDAFGFRVQPELWSASIFSSLYRALKPGGLLVTYAARTIIRDNMKAAGFNVRKRPGPPGKREMMQAVKGSFNEIVTS